MEENKTSATSRMKSKMATCHGSGYLSPPPIGRTVDRVFEDAQFTGEIYLNGRKLRDYPKLSVKYDLSDTVLVDISRNRLAEVPHEVCECLFVEKINCYHNVIRSIPDAIEQLQVLTQLNLSRNQLTVLPPALCLLNCLEVLLVSNNKLVSLPEEIRQLTSLMELDVSCNEISHLPTQLGDLSSLRSLNLRRNFLVELPVEISRLQLYKLDFSSNRIERIPTVFRKIETLEQLILDHNPLVSPPAYVCIKGRQHIMKFLLIEAMKEDRKRGILMSSDSDMKRFIRKSLPPQQSSDDFKNLLGAPESKWKRHTVLSNDSGYSTADGSERNGWQSGEIYSVSEENNNGPADALRTFRDNQTRYQQPHHDQQLNQHHHRTLGSSSSSHSDVVRPLSGVGLHHPPSSSVTRGQIYSEPVIPRRASPIHISASYPQYHHPQPQRQNHQDAAHSQHSTQTHVSNTSSHSHSSNVYSLSGSVACRRTTVPSPSFSTHSFENQTSTHNTSYSGSESGASLARQRSNTSLSDYQPRQYTNSSVHLAQRSHSPPNLIRYRSDSPRYGHAKHAADYTGKGSVSSHSTTYFSHREHLPHDRNSYHPLSNRLEQVASASPPQTPPAPPIIATGSTEDEFTRELKRQKADYERKKKQAELIRVQQEEEEEEREKEERRRAALKLQGEQKLVMERQEEQRRLEEEVRKQEELKRVEVRRRIDEEESHRREEDIHKLQETVRIQDGDQLRQKIEGEKRSESKLTDKNNIINNFVHTTNTSRQYSSRPLLPPPPPPPPSSSCKLKRPSFLSLNGKLEPPSPSPLLSSPSSSLYQLSSQHQDGNNCTISENICRNALSSQSFKEQRKLTNSIQYRRAASDTLKKVNQPATSNPQQQADVLNRNGVAENSLQSSTTTTPSVSPSPSPRNSVSHLAKPNSPSGSTSHLAKSISPSGSISHLVKSTGTKSAVPRATNGPAAQAQSQAVRKTKIAGDRSSTSSPVTARSTRATGTSNLRAQSSTLNPALTNIRRSSNSSITDDDSKPRKGPQTPAVSVESSRLKSRLDEQNKKGALQVSAVKVQKPGPPADNVDTNKRINTRPPTNIYGLGRGRPGGPKTLEDSSSNFTLRRKEDKEEAEQMDRLRQMVESRLRVTLPDNLADALRDGVVLCHLANQIRPRSVGSIHVPSPAVPKLTLAKCRRNVDNFLDACKKVGVDQEQLCGPQDIFDEKGICRVAITVAALVTVGTNPRQSAV